MPHARDPRPRVTPAVPGSLPVSSPGPADLRAEAEAVLRELAHVFHLTRRVKADILAAAEARRGDSLSESGVV